MTTAPSGSRTARTARGVGPLLRVWRERRRVSQLELALRAKSSARHISFVETGRSRPSEELILRLADHLDVPMRERNALLLAAGYAPRFPETPLDDPALDALRAGIDQLLRGYEPYPALVVGATYDVLAANRGIAMLLAGVPEDLLVPPLNAMRVTLHPRGLAPRIRNLRTWREHLLAQVERRLALAGSEALEALYEEIAAYPAPEAADTDESETTTPGDPADPAAPADGCVPPFALPMRIAHGDRVLSFVSSISTFNTPMDVTVAELAIETFLPADPATAAYLRSLTP